MLQSKEMIKRIVGLSILVLALGFGLMFLGYSLSGFNIEKYQTDNKRWYQVISLPKI